MTHILMSFTVDGNLIAVKPILAKTEEDLQIEIDQFKAAYVDEVIGDTFGIMEEEEKINLESLNDNEVYETGI